MKSRSAAAVAAAAAVLLAACPGNPSHRAPVAPDDGLQLSGRIGGQQLHVSDGEPEVAHGPCDGNDGVALCITSFTIDGALLALVIEHAETLVEGETVSVVRSCPPDGCEGATVVAIRRADGRVTAEGGELVVSAAGERFAARFTLRVPGGGTLTGRFNVQPGRATS